MSEYSDYMSVFFYLNYLYMLPRGEGISYKFDLSKHQLERNMMIKGGGFLGGALVDDFYVCGQYPNNKLIKYDLRKNTLLEFELKEEEKYIVNCLYDGSVIYCLTQNGDILAFDKNLNNYQKIEAGDNIVEKTKWACQNIAFVGENILLIPNRRTPWKIVNKRNYKINVVDSLKELHSTRNDIFPCRNIIDGFNVKYIPVINGKYHIYSVKGECVVEGWNPCYANTDKQYIEDELVRLIDSGGLMLNDNLDLLIRLLKYTK